MSCTISALLRHALPRPNDDVVRLIVHGFLFGFPDDAAAAWRIYPACCQLWVDYSKECPVRTSYTLEFDDEGVRDSVYDYARTKFDPRCIRWTQSNAPAPPFVLAFWHPETIAFDALNKIVAATDPPGDVFVDDYEHFFSCERGFWRFAKRPWSNIECFYSARRLLSLVPEHRVDWLAAVLGHASDGSFENMIETTMALRDSPLSRGDLRFVATEFWVHVHALAQTPVFRGYLLFGLGWEVGWILEHPTMSDDYVLAKLRLIDLDMARRLQREETNPRALATRILDAYREVPVFLYGYRFDKRRSAPPLDVTRLLFA